MRRSTWLIRRNGWQAWWIIIARAVVLYGPPASGKDTVTAALLQLCPDYALFQRLKVGTGRLDGYRLTTCDEVKRLRALELVLYENERYGNRYVIDRPTVEAFLKGGRIPILHIGQLAGIRAVQRYPAAWLPVLLWCSRGSAAKRLSERSASDVAARLAAWDETLTDLSQSHHDFALRIDTDQVEPDIAAGMIHAHMRVARGT